MSPLAGRFSDRRGRLAPLLAGLVGGAITFAILPWPNTALTLAIVIVVGSPVIGLLWAPAMAMLSDGADHVGLEQGLAFGLMNLTWATGQSHRRHRRLPPRRGRGRRGGLPHAVGDLRRGVRRPARVGLRRPRPHDGA